MGLAVLAILGDLPHVRCEGTLGDLARPPWLLLSISKKTACRVHLVHYAGDKLCACDPYDSFVHESPFRMTVVRNDDNNLDQHFGRSERKDAAAPELREAAPARLISWLSFRLPSDCVAFIEEMMRKRSVERDYSEQKMLACARERLVHGGEVASHDEVIRVL